MSIYKVLGAALAVGLTGCAKQEKPAEIPLPSREYVEQMIGSYKATVLTPEGRAWLVANGVPADSADFYAAYDAKTHMVSYPPHFKRIPGLYKEGLTPHLLGAYQWRTGIHGALEGVRRVRSMGMSPEEANAYPVVFYYDDVEKCKKENIPADKCGEVYDLFSRWVPKWALRGDFIIDAAQVPITKLERYLNELVDEPEWDIQFRNNIDLTAIYGAVEFAKSGKSPERVKQWLDAGFVCDPSYAEKIVAWDDAGVDPKFAWAVHSYVDREKHSHIGDPSPSERSSDAVIDAYSLLENQRKRVLWFLSLNKIDGVELTLEEAVKEAKKGTSYDSFTSEARQLQEEIRKNGVRKVLR